jgi:hypothetical protein
MILDCIQENGMGRQGKAAQFFNGFRGSAGRVLILSIDDGVVNRVKIPEQHEEDTNLVSPSTKPPAPEHSKHQCYRHRSCIPLPSYSYSFPGSEVEETQDPPLSI